MPPRDRFCGLTFIGSADYGGWNSCGAQPAVAVAERVILGYLQVRRDRTIKGRLGPEAIPILAALGIAAERSLLISESRAGSV